MPDAMVMVVILVLALIAAALILGALRWQRGTRALRSALAAARLPVRPTRVDFGELDSLPPPVQRFFRAALAEGQAMVASAHLRHSGTFNMGKGAEQWKPFTSDQLVVTRRPGFDWDGRIAMMPGLHVRVHDAYIAGEGLLQASLLGLVPLARVRGAGAMAEGELMRYLAEAAWYPTSLLPSQGVLWQAVDERSARATLTDGSVTVSLVFTFTPEGLIESVRADARGRMVDKQFAATPWQGRFWNHAERAGMHVPLDGEVAWIMPTGAKPYWRGRLNAIRYEFS